MDLNLDEIISHGKIQTIKASEFARFFIVCPRSGLLRRERAKSDSWAVFANLGMNTPRLFVDINAAVLGRFPPRRTGQLAIGRRRRRLGSGGLRGERGSVAARGLVGRRRRFRS